MDRYSPKEMKTLGDLKLERVGVTMCGGIVFGSVKGKTAYLVFLKPDGTWSYDMMKVPKKFSKT